MNILFIDVYGTLFKFDKSTNSFIEEYTGYSFKILEIITKMFDLEIVLISNMLHYKTIKVISDISHRCYNKSLSKKISALAIVEEDDKLIEIDKFLKSLDDKNENYTFCILDSDFETKDVNFNERLVETNPEIGLDNIAAKKLIKLFDITGDKING